MKVNSNWNVPIEREKKLCCWKGKNLSKRMYGKGGKYT